MPTYNSIKELTRGLQQGAKLLNDMFIKRKTVSVKYDDAVETLDGEENRLKHLINGHFTIFHRKFQIKFHVDSIYIYHILII